MKGCTEKFADFLENKITHSKLDDSVVAGLAEHLRQVLASYLGWFDYVA